MANTSSEVVLEVESRDDTGKNACRRMRADGRVPGNVYGLDRPPFKVAVNPRRIDEVLRLGSGVNTIFALALKGETRKREAMIKEIQRDPITERPLHIDFVRVDPTRTLHVSVPIQLTGIPTGVKNDGGILDFVHREVQIECLPANIPEHLDVDISELHINQHVAVKDLGVGADFTILDDPEQIVAVVAAPRAEEEVAVAEDADAAAEPEVAEKGKEDEAGGEPEAPKGN